MAEVRGYTLLDVVPTGDLLDTPLDGLSYLDSIVRRLEYVRVNIRSIIPHLPQACEIDLMASGHAHCLGNVPLLGLYCPSDQVQLLPDPFEMYDAMSQWFDSIPIAELNRASMTIEAPTWPQLLEYGLYPRR